MTLAKGGIITGTHPMPIFALPDGYVLSARAVRELGVDPGWLAKLNAAYQPDDGHQA